MANERDLKDRNASKIWRTVVFAGAMLGAPTVVTADSPAPAQPTKAMPAPKADPVQEKAKKIETLDGERKALLAKLVEAEPKDLDALKKEIAAKDTQIKRTVDELVNLRKPRPRTPVVQKPVGRGFVLA